MQNPTDEKKTEEANPCHSDLILPYPFYSQRSDHALAFRSCIVSHCVKKKAKKKFKKKLNTNHNDLASFSITAPFILSESVGIVKTDETQGPFPKQATKTCKAWPVQSIKKSPRPMCSLACSIRDETYMLVYQISFSDVQLYIETLVHACTATVQLPLLQLC